MPSGATVPALARCCCQHERVEGALGIGPLPALPSVCLPPWLLVRRGAVGMRCIGKASVPSARLRCPVGGRGAVGLVLLLLAW